MIAVTELLEWLLDLQNIRLGHDAPLLLKWNSPLEAWMLFCFALPAVVAIALIYFREDASLTRRIVLVAIRCGIVGVVVVVICQPSLVLQRNRVEPSWVALVLDTSQSMTASERYHDQELALSVARGAGLDDPSELADHSRLELIRNALTRDDAAALKALLCRHSLQLCTFAGSSTGVPAGYGFETLGFFSSVSTAGVPAGSATRAAGSSPRGRPRGLNPAARLIAAINNTEAVGPTTDLAGAISRVIDKAQGRRLAAIVLATDGQATARPALPVRSTSLKYALDLARDRQIPIFPLRIGSMARPLDIEVGSLRAPESALVNDLLVVEAQLSARGLTKSTAVTIVLIDERAGKTVASEQALLGPAQASVTLELKAKAARPGRVRYRVEASPLPDELTTDNNTQSVEITILDNRTSVLYVDGYPRYEYRYLKNALVRELTMELSVLLIEADERFVQDGTSPIRRFPQTPEELFSYDVVLFGDVDPRAGWLSGAQMNMLLDFVGNKGGGFGLIAGERAAPYRYLGTPLEKLIPVRIDPTFFGRYDAALVAGFRARMTTEGRRSRILRLAADRTESELLFDALPELFWFARTLGPKPGASVLAEHPTIGTDTGAMPIVVTGRYGAGRLFFQATDDTWRWRRNNGELLHDTYWVRVARELMSGSRVERDRHFMLRTDRRVYPYGAAVQTRLELFDSQLIAEQGEVIRILVTQAPVTRSGQTEPRVPKTVARFDVHAISPESNVFEGTWVPPGAGRFLIQAEHITPRLGKRAALVPIRIEPPDLEARRPEADHEMLQRIAVATGGRVVDLDQLEAEFLAIKSRSVQIPDDLIEPLWDSRLVLMLFVGMISMEWILRKAFGLL